MSKKDGMKMLAALLTAVLLIPYVMTPVRVQADTGSGTELLMNHSSSETVSYRKEEIELARQKAIQWLTEYVGSESQTTNVSDYNQTCDAIALLAAEGENVRSEKPERYMTENEAMNTDEACHMVWGRNDASLLETIWNRQNADGGFGLTEDYASEPYDTLLVLQAEAYVHSTNTVSGEVMKAIHYMTELQSKKGGIGYTELDSVRTGLSAELALVLRQWDIGTEDTIEQLTLLCKKEFHGDFSEEGFQEQARIARLLYSEEAIENEGEIEDALLELPDQEGSIYGNVSDTIQYILLLDAVHQFHTLKLHIISMQSTADSYVLEPGSVPVTLTTEISYETNQDVTAILRYIVTEDNEPVLTEDMEVLLAGESITICPDHKIEIPTESERRYVQLIQLVLQDMDTSEETILAENTFDYTIHVREDKELALEVSDTSGREEYSELTWTDMTTEDDRFGYRIYRSREDGPWETRSTWNGEKVKVLNIYPCASMENTLKDWMEREVDEEGNTAGMGLFDIDTVLIDDYNDNPDSYLKDEEGNYIYDVLMFGTYDRNSDKDLNDISYEATRQFVDSGRGILFGHDTVTANSTVFHPVFARFADRLGVKLTMNGSFNRGDKVKVVNTGFLTSYPWKLSGTLTIPTAHALGQFTGGTTEATVWMEFANVKYSVDAETNAKNNAYLFSKDALAMIQTGHSNGAATEDECKIVANTLFYLKQLTTDTSMRDNAFYDEASPKMTGVSELSKDGHIILSATDYGTSYSYYVEAVNEAAQKGTTDDTQSKILTSNVVEAEAVSGVQGYIIGMSDSEDSMEELLTYDEAGNLTVEIYPAEDGVLDYQLEGLEAGDHAYLHIYAVDFAGNVSEESVVEVTGPEEEEPDEDSDYFDIPYALFASEDMASISCCTANIKGDIYGNSSFHFQGSILELDGTALTPGKLSIAGGVLHLTGQEEGIAPVTLPDYMENIIRDIRADGQPVEELNVYNSTEITIPTICNSTTGAWCGDLNIGESLVSCNGIYLNANTVQCGAGKQVVLCSEQGDIQINATKYDGSGLIYAPNGTVTINVSEFNYKGTIVAKKIVFQAGYVNINQ